MIKFFSDITRDDVKDAGGKGASLGELTHIGIPVPLGFVITTPAFKQYSESEIPVDVIEQIYQAFDQLGAERVAVRSSAVAEDSSSASWAGQLESYLNTTRDQLIDRIRDCWNSVNSERALAYAGQQGVSQEDLAVAVVVQKMVNSESSGVTFSVNPITKNSQEIMIEAGFGLGEMLVQGMITPDNFVIDKDSLEIKSRDIQSQETKLIYQDGENKEVEIPLEQRDQPAISDDNVKDLAKLAKTIEEHYGKPMDIEWAIENGEIFIVQARPITTLELFNQNGGDKSNGKVLLTGLAAAGGIKSGKARVISSLYQVSEVEEGEVLVTTKTTPDFIEAFGKVVAVVTNQGGITSHAAIVSRELGLPAVVGTQNGTEKLKTGQIVTVDGNQGKVYEGEVELQQKEAPKKELPKLHPTGDDIDDFIQAVTFSVNEVTELWPMKPGRLIPYYDLDQCLNLYEHLRKLKENGELSRVAKLLEHPTIIRMFVVNSGISGMKAATMLKINNSTIDDQVKFFNLLLDLLKELMPDDPLCIKGTNKVWSEQKVTEYVSNNEWTQMDEELRRAVNLLAVSLNTFIWAFYWDYSPDGGFETYGTYHVNGQKFGNSHTLIINDFFNLKPTEVWPVAEKMNHKHIVLSQVYDSEDAFFRIGNRIANQDQLSGHNNFFSLQVNGKSVTDREEILNLAKEIGKIAQEQTNFVNGLEEFDVVRKGAMLSYYSWIPLYGYLKEPWYPEATVEATIQKLGREFLDANTSEGNKDLETKKKFFDPRNDFL